MNLLRLLLCTALLALAGCELLAPRETPKPPALPQASGIDAYLEVMNVLALSDPARQSEMFSEVEMAYSEAPTTANTLRYALALATPDHPAFNPTQGKKMLEQLLAGPEHLSTGERSLANIMLNTMAAWLKMQNEIRRLAATVNERTRAQTDSDRRAQVQTEEIARLRKELDAARQKLDAILNVERSIIERSSSTSTR